MRKRNRTDNLNNVKYFSPEECSLYTGLGKQSAVKLAKECDAVIRIGRRVLIDRVLLDQGIEALRQKER